MLQPVLASTVPGVVVPGRRVRGGVQFQRQERLHGRGPGRRRQQYLAGVEHDVVNDIDFTDLQIDKALVRGEDGPEPPGGQSIWIASIMLPVDRTPTGRCAPDPIVSSS